MLVLAKIKSGQCPGTEQNFHSRRTKPLKGEIFRSAATVELSFAIDEELVWVKGDHR